MIPVKIIIIMEIEKPIIRIINSWRVYLVAFILAVDDGLGFPGNVETILSFDVYPGAGILSGVINDVRHNANSCMNSSPS